ncbi:MAG: hypothetical protein P1U56_26835, partial [Saprospiraceae bacterium]|nr:hypothetical protein [Saprospiraceae bacterium]
MIIYNLLIIAFGCWNVFKKNKALSPIFGLGFLAMLGLTFLNVYNAHEPMDEKILTSVAILLGLGVLGYILIALSKNKLAQVGAVIMAAVGFNMYVNNPHTPIDPSIQLDTESELIIRLNHKKKEKLTAQLNALDFVSNIQPILSPQDANSTELDDYITLNIKDGYDINSAIGTIGQVAGIEWIEPNEVLELDIQRTKAPDTKSDFIKSVNDPLSVQQWNMQALDMSTYYDLFRSGQYAPRKTAKLFILDSGVDAKHE